jgi:hypothetical protein
MVKDKGRWKGVTRTAKDSKLDINRAFNTDVEIEHLDEDYTIQVPKESKTTDQGWLVVGKLQPKIALLPQFLFRWDEKDQRLDVDIEEVSDTTEKSFKQGKNGYSGHHARKSEKDGRFFDIDIWIPGKHVFKGCISFNLAITAEATARARPRAHPNVTVVSR